MPRILAFFIFINFISACGVNPQSENYKINSSAELNLTALSHPHGFGQKECFMCHIPTNLHRVNRLNDPSFSSAQPTVEQFGILRCYVCHGSNGGVSP